MIDYSFFNKCKETARNGWNKEEKAAYDSIIHMLFQLHLYGKEKARQLDEYDGESLFQKTTLYPGHIYAFIYKAKEPSVYDDGHIKFKYSDTLPIVLVTHIDRGRVRGINLNLCSYGLRAYILNTLYNLDLEFFNKTNSRMAGKGEAPISKSVTRTFLNEDTEKAFFEHIARECKLQHTEMLYRTYSVENIKEVRMIEIWQYKYIPFLTYTGEMKSDILQLIHKVTGTDNLRLA